MTIASAPTSGPVKRLLTIFGGPTLLLAVGLGLSAIAGSGFIATVNHSGLPPEQIAPLPGLYLLLSAIGTGMFAGFEQEMTRAVSRALALGQPEHVVIRHQVRNAAYVAAATVLVLCAGSPFVVHKWMYGNWVVFAELLLGLAGTWAAFLVRGVLSGRRQFRSYAITMVVEGASRLLPAIVLAVTGLTATWGFGLVFSFGFVIAALSGLVVARAPITDDVPPPDDVDRELESANQAAKRLARLTGGIMAGQVLVYAVPLFINAQITNNPGLVISVTAAIGLTRLALLVLFPLQAPLLPKLSAAAARHEMGAVRRTTAGLVAACVGAGLIGLLVTVAVGPWIVHTVMGGPGHLTRTFLGELATGTIFMLVANVLQSALIALNRQQTVLVGWVAGVVVMGLMFLLPFGVLTTAAVAAMGGPLATMLLMGFDVLRVTRTPAVGPGPAPEPAADAAEAEAVRQP
jgi:O-antigen/teichoic acid export membrane protein